MASLELCALSEHLEDPVIEALVEQLESPLDHDEEAQNIPIEQAFDEDAFDDFWDQLDANDAACDVYLPQEFEETFTVQGMTFGSAHALLLALANLKEEMFIEDDDDDDDDDEFGDDDDDFGEEVEDADDSFDGYGDDEEAFGHSDDESHIELKDEQLRMVWRSIHKGARLAVRKHMPLFIHNH